MLVRARTILPVSRPPIEDGAISISGHRIRFVGPWKDVSRTSQRRAIDLGDVILLPGLINAHCHLDYTHMAGQFPPPKVFTDWIKLITAGKGTWSYSEFALSWIEGAKMLLRTGTTTVGDIEAIPELLPDVWASTPMRIFSFLEMTGVKSRRPPEEIVQTAMEKLRSLPIYRCRVGLSPHSPYSTAPKLLNLATQVTRQKHLRVVTHVSESDQEYDMFMHRRGQLFDWLARNERDMSDCGLGSPIQHMERAGALCENLLAVHVNYTAPGDALLLGKRKVSVVHCPRSHAYFKHQAFPLHELTAARVNLCLGTDSLASVYQGRKKTVELNMFEEMRELAATSPNLSPETILKMATINGARALGMKGEAGQLVAGAFADLIAIPYSGRTSAVYDAVLEHPGDVTSSMINGRWAIQPLGLQDTPTPGSHK
ncbi:amidohydrolase family protein [Pedosphaera parvula]|uniref:Amidohydrolase n=1 Tax=Pedosphaera parvula (strain Ellin514) TaxID=320771 RepID=B9XGM1_PEDPL|nr:amidohydrolase family protein [Pedosphaera parvula]EEF61072.1 amidohydrolase [Pedosphaera parvula Ellin514]